MPESAQNKLNQQNIQGLRELIGWNIRNALLGEVYATPKPGLVDRHDTGAHRDMNFETFLRSTEAITPYMTDMFLLGLTGDFPKEAFLNSEQFTLLAQSNRNAKYLVETLDQIPGFDPTMEYTDGEKIFLKSRVIGMQAEKAMFEATNDVNTHKGMIFTMGIVLASMGMYVAENRNEIDRTELKKGRDSGNYVDGSNSCSKDDQDSEIKRSALKENESYEIVRQILATTKNMTCQILKKELSEMEKRPAKTHGEKLYAKYHELGIRGQAMEGFPIIGETAYPAMEAFNQMTREKAARHGTVREELFSVRQLQASELSAFDSAQHIQDLKQSTKLSNRHFHASEQFENARNITVLLSIMAVLNDTNVLTRGTRDDLCWLQEASKEALQLGGAFTEEGIRMIEDMNRHCIERNLSPGGAADILAVTILLFKILKEQPI